MHGKTDESLNSTRKSGKPIVDTTNRSSSGVIVTTTQDTTTTSSTTTTTTTQAPVTYQTLPTIVGER